MYRFIRTATLKNAAYTPTAMGFATELTGYLNKNYNVNLHYGMEMFDTLNVHWHFDVDTLDKISEFNTKLMQDKGYWAMLDKVKDIWTSGTLKDTVVMLAK